MKSKRRLIGRRVQSGSKATEEAKASQAIPFQGTVATVDEATRTFTLSSKTTGKSRQFKVAEGVQILQDNQPVSFGSITVGGLVRGQAYKQGEGWDAKKVMIGSKSGVSVGTSAKR